MKSPTRIYGTLISPEALLERMASDLPIAVFDTRFSLADTEQGRRDYRRAHIPGAVYAHLDEDLSGPVVGGKTGRHPLPDPLAFAERIGRWGVGNETQVVVYDDANGGIAARLWWMLRWLGHDAAAVLDGGWQAWSRAGLPQTDRIPEPAPVPFMPRIRPELSAGAEEIMALPLKHRKQVVDARTADRYAGKNETIDPIAGHIPGASNLPYQDTAHPDGRSLARKDLQTLIRSRLPGIESEQTIVYCGSGVTACRTILAMEHAGLHGARLYPGSWSEWIRRSTEIARGSHRENQGNQ